MTYLQRTACSRSQGSCQMAAGRQSRTSAITKKNSTYHVVMYTLEKTSAVALGVLSFCINWPLFVQFFAAGVAIGLYSGIKEQNKGRFVRPSASCTQGLLEQLTGVKLPAPVGLAVNVAVTVCHLDHHAKVFVPIVAVSLGAWAGKCAAPLFKRVRIHRTHRTAAA